jgi:hypothetical protein
MGRAVFHTAFELSPVTVEPRKDLDAALLAGAVLEQFLFTGADGAFLHRALDHLKTGGNFVGVNVAQ